MSAAIPAYLQRYEDLAYGLFLHWGLYSQLESGEWVRHYRAISKEEYARLAESFTAEKFDARALVSWAKRVGFRYICLTTRHHDGFSLYDTRGLNDFDAPHSAAKRDLIAEYAEACHAEDIAMFFYHTTLDWSVASFKTDFPQYLKYLRRSVEMLCTNYGKVAGFWFDGNWDRPEADWEEDALYELIRSHHPECVIINNSSTKARGQLGHPQLDAVTFEQGAPARVTSSERYVASEVCETLNSHWGVASTDFSHKSPAALISTLTACRGAGANLLLNLGPLSDGSLPAYEKSALELVGKWIETCGPSIYKGRPSGLICSGKDFVLEAEGAFYYFAHQIPIAGNMHLHTGPEQSSRTIRGDLPRITSASWTDNNESLSFAQEQGSLCLNTTPFPYGRQTVVRVIKLEVEK